MVVRQEWLRELPVVVSPGINHLESNMFDEG